MISHKHKFIFVHIDKTAGSSIEKTLDPSLKEYKSGYTNFKGKHYSAKTLSEKFPSEFKEYFKFSFVRNPFEREVSLYFFYVKTRFKKISLNFSEFLLKRYSSRQSWDTAFYTYLDALSLGNNEYNVDFIGRFENLQQDFNTVCDKIGIPRQQLPHKNKSKHKHYTEYYDDETKQIVAEKYAKDIEYFGYKFGE